MHSYANIKLTDFARASLPSADNPKDKQSTTIYTSSLTGHTAESAERLLLTVTGSESQELYKKSLKDKDANFASISSADIRMTHFPKRLVAGRKNKTQRNIFWLGTKGERCIKNVKFCERCTARGCFHTSVLMLALQTSQRLPLQLILERTILL